MFGASCGCDHSKNTQEFALGTLPPANAGDTTGETTEYPVMVGTLIVKADAEDKGLYRGHEGQRYWPCCPGCGPKFDADPAQYAHAG